MSSVGQVLRGARLEQRLDLPTLSAQTKISVRYLEAIEADDRRCFPSGFFYKSFVDQYAGILGLDASAINAQVDRLLSEDAPLPLPGFESVVSKNVAPVKSVPRFPSRVGASLAALLLAGIGCAGVYGWWHRSELASFARMLRKPAAATRSVAVSNPTSQESPPVAPQESPAVRRRGRQSSVRSHGARSHLAFGFIRRQTSILRRPGRQSNQDRGGQGVRNHEGGQCSGH